jgi:hypothetical protein
MSTVDKATDTILVNRAGTDYRTTVETMSALQDTDLLLINRGGVDYRCDAKDVKAALGGGGGGGLYKDSTLGTSPEAWTNADKSSLGRPPSGMNAVDPVSGTCITLGYSGIGRSTDFKNWTVVHNLLPGPKGGVHPNAVMPLGKGKWLVHVGSSTVTTEGVLWKSSVDDGLTWQDAPQINNNQTVYGGDGAGNMIYGNVGDVPSYSTDMGLSKITCSYPDMASAFEFKGAGAAFDGTKTKWVGFSTRSYSQPDGNAYRILTSSDGITFTTAKDYPPDGTAGGPNQAFTAVVTNWTTPLVTMVIDNRHSEFPNAYYPIIIAFKADTNTVVQKDDLYNSTWGGDGMYFGGLQPTSDPAGNYVGLITVDAGNNNPSQVWIGSGSFASSLTMHYGGTVDTSGQAAIRDGVIVTNLQTTSVSPY